ncbi:hypothetical protein [Lishizhenia sp.]|uniref:hypothetical protein n=1 Tax=Lishizhenia sp. TaxID=2497594 RepID=UPI00299F019C|nr:hypothetical protein [Lishizhenia sp.]MDX1444637.1 hypothetical protein [Lishizhenia sp.]
MSKTASNSIHELIKSLSKSEKRYFKIISSRHTIGEQNNYITLFDYIDSQDEYDEAALFKHFKGETFLNKFSITKNRLYEAIMKALDAYHSSSSIDASIYRLLHGAEILYKKSLYKHCKKQLLSAERLAKKHDRYGLLVEINNRYKKLIETEGYHNIDSSDLNKTLKEDSEYLDKLNHYSQLWKLKSELFLLLNNKGKARSIEELQRYNLLTQELTKSSSKEAHSFDSDYLTHHIYSASYFASNDLENSLIHLDKIIEQYKDNPSRIKQEPNVYFSALSNIIYIESKLGNYKKAIDYLKELKTFPKVYKIDLTRDLEIKLFSSVNSIELTLLIHQGKFEEAVGLSEGIQKGLALYGNKISPLRKSHLSFKLGVAYFSLEQYHTALEWINSILNNGELDQKEDLNAFVQIVDLMIHLELKHQDLLPYAIKNTQRFLKSRNRSFKFETIFLKYLNKIAKSTDKFQEHQLLEKVLLEIKEIKNDDFEKSALEYFDFESWIISKLKNKPMPQIRKEVYNKLIA